MPSTARENKVTGMPTCPISMFWGLPITVAAEPMLLETDSPIRNGSGVIPVWIKAIANTGVNAKQTMSLAKTADRKALASMVAKRKALGRPSNNVIFKAAHV